MNVNRGGAVETKGRILVVAEEDAARSALVDLLRGEGYAAAAVADGWKALSRLPDFAPDLVISDRSMVGLDGLGLLSRVQEHDANVAVVLMMPAGAGAAVLAALRAGARACLATPINPLELSLVVERELAHRLLGVEVDQLRARLAERYRFENMIGSSASMQAVFKTVSQVATARASVLLTGESGTGKELIAAAIHEKSPRAKGPFVKVHCSALTEALLDSELFGHERGALPDATARRDGRFVQAHGGTLFLDEISAISPAIQVKLLRALQDHSFERIGGDDTISADVRVIAATDRDLHQMIVDGKFREDLFYRLNVVNIEMPPLRDRVSDVPLLAMHFVAKYAAENNKSVSGLAEEALERLCGYPWPGNVRELENVIERAVVLCAGAKITGAELPPNLQSAKVGAEVQIPGSTLDSIERYAITKTLEATAGSTSRAAEILGISIRKVQYKLHEYQGTRRSDTAVAGPTLKRN
jgi:DNA-binding NtrC family response regulator